jgi:hypothetical protein
MMDIDSMDDPSLPVIVIYIITVDSSHNTAWTTLFIAISLI